MPATVAGPPRCFQAATLARKTPGAGGEPAVQLSRVEANCASAVRGEAQVRAGRLLSVLALALLLAGCDKCGNWNLGFAAPFGIDACRNTVPSQ